MFGLTFIPKLIRKNKFRPLNTSLKIVVLELLCQLSQLQIPWITKRALTFSEGRTATECIFAGKASPRIGNGGGGLYRHLSFSKLCLNLERVRFLSSINMLQREVNKIK